MRKNVKRLFTQFQPSHYVLNISVDKESMTFSGLVIITGKKIGRPSKRITLHQHQLKITSAHITYHEKKGDHDVYIERINHHHSFDEVRLHANQLLYPGEYTLRLSFSGKITENMNGIYPCYYDDAGVKQVIIATQFESHHAREAFPCIDEPEAKATFDIHITAPAGETVLSNTQPIETITSNGTQTVSFETTPHMSTYLVAFVIGKLEYHETKSIGGTSLRAYATPANIEHTQFALSVAAKCLDYYEDYFAIEFPLAKCDFVALPDFASGAMENWGLITFREQAFLVDPANTSLPAKQYVAMVVAHELAHQWFGNLVTMRWWTDLWLNEGFASWIEYLAVDKLFPEWNMWTQFIVDEQYRALKLDALEHTHPIEVPVTHPEEIRTIFDTISYSKGASVIHMLHEYLGADNFRDGLRHYLNRHKYGNTDTIDLWQALEEISDKPVKDFMHAWTSQPGFPLVNAEILDGSVSLTQHRFFLNKSHAPDDARIWPVALLTHDSNVPDLLSGPSIKFHDPEDNVKLNRGQSGFYRVTYNASHLHRLGELIHRGKLTELDRLGILSDVFESAKAGYTHTIDAINFLSNFSEEHDYAVWDVISASIASVRNVMDSEDLRDYLKPFTRNLIAKQLGRLGWGSIRNEPYFDSLLRPLILGLASSSDEPQVVAEALSRFHAMQKPEDVDPDLRSVIYGTAVRHGNQQTFDKLATMHNESSSSEERVTIAAAITGFKDESLVMAALAMIKGDEVRIQDVSYWVAYSFMNRFGRDLTWAWMQENWYWLQEKLGTDMSFSRFPHFAANAYNSEEFLTDFKSFFLPKNNPAFDRAIKQSIETLEWHIDWKRRDFRELLAYFSERANI